MTGLISYLAHQGIVRVLSVPIFMALMIYAMWLLAAPPEDLDEDDGQGQRP